MFRKWLIFFITVSLVASFLASCEVSTEDPLSLAPVSGPSSEAESSIEESLHASSSEGESYVSEIAIIESSEPEESSEDTSSEVSEEISYPNPTFQGGDVSTPENPDEALIPIRSITQGELGVLQLIGDIDLTDPETAAAVLKIEEMLAGYDKNISFCAYSLDGSRAIAYNCEETYFSACTIKAGYMLYCCLAIDQGLASKDEVMYYQKDKYYHGGSGKIKNAEDGTPYTLGELIELSLSVSDNIAYKMLFAYFGTDGYNRMVEELGVPRLKLSSSVWNRKTTARDLCIIWRELYFYFDTETTMAKLFRRSCTNTRFNYATIYLDEEYSHKSGDRFEPDPVYNDAAIVWKEMPYVISTLNSSEGEPADEELVGTIVKLINDHIMK